MQDGPVLTRWDSSQEVQEHYRWQETDHDPYEPSQLQLILRKRPSKPLMRRKTCLKTVHRDSNTPLNSQPSSFHPHRPIKRSSYRTNQHPVTNIKAWSHELKLHQRVSLKLFRSHEEQKLVNKGQKMRSFIPEERRSSMWTCIHLTSGESHVQLKALINQDLRAYQCEHAFIWRLENHMFN